MNEKFNKNAKVEKFTTMLGIAVRLIIIDPFGPVTVNLDIFASIYFCEFKQKAYRFILVLLIFANSFIYLCRHIINSFNFM